jgi:hypothetical protein
MRTRGSAGGGAAGGGAGAPRGRAPGEAVEPGEVPWPAPRELARLTGHKNDLTQAKWSHAGGALATGSRDGSVRVWRAVAPPPRRRRRDGGASAGGVADAAAAAPRHWAEAALLQCPRLEPEGEAAAAMQRRRRPPPPLEVNQVAWNADDSLVSPFGRPTGACAGAECRCALPLPRPCARRLTCAGEVLVASFSLTAAATAMRPSSSARSSPPCRTAACACGARRPARRSTRSTRTCGRCTSSRRTPGTRGSRPQRGTTASPSSGTSVRGPRSSGARRAFGGAAGRAVGRAATWARAGLRVGVASDRLLAASPPYCPPLPPCPPRQV